MNWLSFLTPKWLIIATLGALGTLLAVQSYRLYQCKIDYAELETAQAELKGSLIGTISANESNMILIDRYQKANKALIEHNAQNTEQSKAIAEQHQERLNEIKNRYEKARTTQIAGTCVNFIINDELDRMLKERAKRGY